MPGIGRLVAIGSVAGWLAWIGPGEAMVHAEPAPSRQAADGQAPAPASRETFEGLWDYNADESIDVLTGRPEQSPRGATQRGSRSGLATAGGEGRGRGRRNTDGLSLGPTPEMMREARDMARDLLEVPEMLRIALGPDSVTFTDDLDRVRTYGTTGRKERHQIAASRFDVTTSWQDGQLHQAIESSSGFTMDQTFFVSPDGRRLFVIIRIGDARDDEPQPGYNRVYDRVTTDGSPAS